MEQGWQECGVVRLPQRFTSIVARFLYLAVASRYLLLKNLQPATRPVASATTARNPYFQPITDFHF